jgi:hypothetical protein
MDIFARLEKEVVIPFAFVRQYIIRPESFADLHAERGTKSDKSMEDDGAARRAHNPLSEPDKCRLCNEGS